VDKEGKYCYWRVVHYYKVDGKTRKRVCYLGPVNREYIYVEKVHKLALTNLIYQDPSKIIYNAVTRLIDEARTAKPEKKKQLLEKIKKLRELMSELLLELENIEKELGE
jgi:ATP-dependent Zn protease